MYKMAAIICARSQFIKGCSVQLASNMPHEEQYDKQMKKIEQFLFG